MRISGALPGAPYVLLICTPEVLPSRAEVTLDVGLSSIFDWSTDEMAPVSDERLAVP